MRDHVARELKGHNILAVERFQDKTRWMVESPARNAGKSKSNGMPASLRGISWTSSPKRNATRKPDKLRGRNEYVYR